MHGVNFVMMMLDMILSKTNIVPSHFIAVIVLPMVYCVFQWIHHAMGGSWAYPFLSVSGSTSPGWYARLLSFVITAS